MTSQALNGPVFGAMFLGKRDILNPLGSKFLSKHVLKKLVRCVALMYFERRFLAVLYKGISSAGSSTMTRLFCCWGVAASGELNGLFLPVLAVLTTVVFDADSSVVRDVQLVLVLERLMLMLGFLGVDNSDCVVLFRLVVVNRLESDWIVGTEQPSFSGSLVLSMCAATNPT